MKRFDWNKKRCFSGIGVGLVFGVILGFILEEFLGTPVLCMVTGISSGAIGGGLMAMLLN